MATRFPGYCFFRFVSSREQMIGGFFQRPTVGFDIHHADKTLGFAAMMRGVQQIVLAEQNLKTRARESGIAFFRGLGQLSLLDRFAQ